MALCPCILLLLMCLSLTMAMLDTSFSRSKHKNGTAGVCHGKGHQQTPCKAPGYCCGAHKSICCPGYGPPAWVIAVIVLSIIAAVGVATGAYMCYHRRTKRYFRYDNL